MFKFTRAKLTQLWFQIHLISNHYQQALLFLFLLLCTNESSQKTSQLNPEFSGWRYVHFFQLVRILFSQI